MFSTTPVIPEIFVVLPWPFSNWTVFQLTVMQVYSQLLQKGNTTASFFLVYMSVYSNLLILKLSSKPINSLVEASLNHLARILWTFSLMGRRDAPKEVGKRLIWRKSLEVKKGSLKKGLKGQSKVNVKHLTVENRGSVLVYWCCLVNWVHKCKWEIIHNEVITGALTVDFVVSVPVELTD